MKQLIASAIVALDGARTAHPAWSRPLGDESLATLDRCDVILYGRVGFLRDRGFWMRPDVADAPMARLLARYPKLVCSTTLAADPGWNATVLRDADQLAARKREPGKHIVVFGSQTLLAQLAGRGLVDEVRMIVTPSPSAGPAWLAGTTSEATTALGLPLAETRELARGVTLRCYRR